MERKYHILWHDTIDSTNSEAVRHLSDIDNMSVIAARRQTSGRGQRGNRWNSTPSENLTFSIVVRPGCDGIAAITAHDQFMISEIATLALTDYLAGHGISARIKWPNDIYWKDRKICGILIEHSIRNGFLGSSVIGIGLNMNQTVFPEDIPNPTSMKAITGKSYITEHELENFITYFDHYLEMAGSGEPGRLYLERMYRKDEPHSFIETATGNIFTGIIRGIAQNACMSVEMPDGSIREFAFKEISYII
ncbi:MAG: biotin--[acetyl-CoA-carboxylase] ligase [Bacteroides sp.]|nr:biotin--[acetyl-CoA-carboxylase] ligase [Bacteroides sp.]